MASPRVRQPQAPRAPAAPRAPGVSMAPAAQGARQQTPPQPVTPSQATGINQDRNSKQYGQTYAVQPTTGGVFHVYANNQRIFVPARAATMQATPASQSAASQAAAAPADPRDAQYYADTAQDTFGRNQKIGQLTGEGQQDSVDHQEALRRLLERQPKDIQSAREQYNRMGLFNSGKLDQAEGDINTSYVRQQGDSERDYERRQAARTAARTALEQGASIDDASRLAEAAGRGIERDTASADAGALVGPEPDSATPAAQSPAKARQAKPKTGVNRRTGKKYTTVTRGGKTYHRYKDGRNVRVRS